MAKGPTHEQAIAEIIINDAQAADRLKNLDELSKKLRDDMSKTNDKKVFDNLNKELKLVEKEFKNVYNQSVNIEKILKDLDGTSFNNLKKAADSLTRQFKAGAISVKEYQNQITPINKRLQELQTIMASGSVQQKTYFQQAKDGWGYMQSAIARYIPILAGAKLLKEGFNRTIQATNDLSDKFAVLMAQGKAAVDSFFRSIATGDWSNLLANMKTAIEAAKEYTEKMILMGDRMRSIDLITKENKKNAELAALDAADQNKSIEERKQKLQESLDLLKENLEITKQIREEVAETEVERVSKEFGIQKDYIRDIIKNYNQYSRVQKDADKSRLDYAEEIFKTEERIKKLNELINSPASKFSAYTGDYKKEKEELEEFLNTVSESDKVFARAFNAYSHITVEARNQIKTAIGDVSDAESEYATAAGKRTSQISGFEKQETEDQKKEIEKRKKEKNDAYNAELKTAEDAYQKNRLETMQQYTKGKIDQATYNADLLTAEEVFLHDKLKLVKKYGENTTKTEQEITQKIIDANNKLKNSLDSSDPLNLSKTLAEAEKLFDQAYAGFTKHLDEQTEAIEKSIDRENELMSKKYAEWTSLRQSLDIVGLDEQHRVEMAKLEELHNAGIMSEELYQQALLAIKLKYAEDYANRVTQFTQGLHSVVSGLENLAIQKSNARKEKELEAAGDNADAKAEIERKYRQEELDIRKKYADANFAMQVAEIISSTAVAAMNAYKAMAGIPVVGPGLGAIAAAAAIAAGAIQIASAKAARDQAKSISVGGSASTTEGSKITSAGGYQSGGYTGPGDLHQPAGVVHRGEYVVPNVVMRNPAAIDHVRVLEAMRKSYYPDPRRYSGFLEGGYASSPTLWRGSGGEVRGDESVTEVGERSSFPLLWRGVGGEALDSLNSILLKLNASVETLNREGAKVSYERLRKAQTDANDVIYRATRK